MQIINNYNSTEIFLFILNCFFSIIGSCLLIHLPSYLFYIDVREFRLLYNTIRENRGLEIFKDYDNIVNHRFWWNFLGVFTQWIYIIISIYFSFGFCANYYYQKTTFLLAFIVASLTDLFLFDILWEVLIAMTFSIRIKGGWLIIICEFMNRMRNMKNLI